MNALSDGLYASTRFKHASVNSTADTSRRRINSEASLSVNIPRSRATPKAGSEDAAAAARPFFRNSLREGECPRRTLSTPFWRGLYAFRRLGGFHKPNFEPDCGR